MELYPHLTFAQAVALLQSKDRGNESALFKSLFKDARERKEELMANRATSQLPGKLSDVVVNTSYGYQIFQDIGLADEKDIQRWTGKKPGDLRMAVFHSKLDGPDSTSNTYPVSLVGLPLDELAGIRRARIYFGHGTLQNEMHLDKSNQLVKEQGSMLFKYVTDQHMKNRPKVP